MRKHIVLRILVIIFIISTGACSESNFDLAPESRLPKWFQVPDGKSRGDFKVTMDYYAGGDVVFKLYEKNSPFVVKKVKGLTRAGEPIKLNNPPSGFPNGRPVYEVITVDGVTDIIEHRVLGPVFHVTDDPAIWKELGVERK